MAEICTSLYPTEKVEDSPYPYPYPTEKVGDFPYPYSYPYPVNAGFPSKQEQVRATPTRTGLFAISNNNI